MIDELNRTVRAIEDLLIEVPYITVTIEKTGATIQMLAKDFDKIIEDIDPCLVVTLPFNNPIFRVERTMMIGTVRVFALYEV